MIKGEIIAIKSFKNQAFTGIISFSAGSLSREKTLGMPENTGFTGSVVANWLHKSVINLLSELSACIKTVDCCRFVTVHFSSLSA